MQKLVKRILFPILAVAMLAFMMFGFSACGRSGGNGMHRAEVTPEVSVVVD